MKKIFLAFDIILSSILNLLDLLICDFLLHRTARIIVPLFSFGRVEVEKIYSEHTGFSWLGLKRLPSGRFLLNSATSMFAGAVFWLLNLVAYLSFMRSV